MTTQLLEVGTRTDGKGSENNEITFAEICNQLWWLPSSKNPHHHRGERKPANEKNKILTLRNKLILCNSLLSVFLCVRQFLHKQFLSVYLYMCVWGRWELIIVERLLREFCIEQKTLIAVIAVIKDLSDTSEWSNTNMVKVKQGKTRGPQQKKNKRNHPSSWWVTEQAS